MSKLWRSVGYHQYSFTNDGYCDVLVEYSQKNLLARYGTGHYGRELTVYLRSSAIDWLTLA